MTINFSRTLHHAICWLVGWLVGQSVIFMYKNRKQHSNKTIFVLMQIYNKLLMFKTLSWWYTIVVSTNCTQIFPCVEL